MGAKFADIVKIGETIEYGLKTGQIACVAASPGSSGSLKKKREHIAAVSYEGNKTLEDPPPPKVFLDRLKHILGLLHTS